MKPNHQQKLIIDHFEGPCLVTAVPGSGKTASLTERANKMIGKGVPPSSILAITFTNKAAEEMRKRIAQVIGADAARQMTISTFHSLCAKLLREYGQRVGLRPGFSIYDSDDQEKVVRQCIAKVDGNEKPDKDYVRDVINWVENKRNSCLADLDALDKWPLIGRQYEVCQAYFETLGRANAIDFTGLLMATLDLLTTNPDVLETCRLRWRYISVDEVQDTNVAQYRIVKLLGAHGNVLCVGDIDQSVYGWRGATPENLLSFERDFKAKVLKLEINYRSTPEILKHAHSLIVLNKMRKPTVLTTDNPSGTPPSAFSFRNDADMATIIAEQIKRLILRGVTPKEIAVLYRVNHASRILENALVRAGIKYRVIGGVGFFDRREIKTALAVLKVRANGNDFTSFARATDLCCKGIGAKTLAKIFDHAVAEECTIVEAASRISLTARQRTQASPLLEALTGELSPLDMLEAVLQKTALGTRLQADSTSENDRCENVRELGRDVGEFMAEGKSLDEYLQHVSLMTSQDESADEQQVSLMTMHACKGLEFDHVLISHANQGIVPHKRVLEVENVIERLRQTEEERRLFYVSMTRARKSLTICCFKRPFGNEKAPAHAPSCFIVQAGLTPRDVGC